MSEGPPLLRLEGVDKSFGSGSGATEVLRGLHLNLAAGETLAVVGPSGCGKSTLLNLAGTLERPNAGRVLFEGRDLGELEGDDLARFRNQSLGFVFQAHHLLPQLSALENVLLPTLADPSANPSAARARAAELLERVGLGARQGHRPGQLSGGERQRVALVRALMQKPRLLLADEPTGSLDEVVAEAMGELLIEQCAAEGASLLLVTHSSSLAASMSRTVRLEGGAVLDRVLRSSN